MQRVPALIASAAQRCSGKVLVVGSASAASRPRSAYHAVLQAAQSTGIPCVPFTPPVADAGGAPASVVDLAVDGLSMARRTGCGSVVVVGGGCTVEIGKAIAALLPSSVSPESLVSPAKGRGGRLAEAVSAAGPTADVVAVPTTLHGCAAASSTRTWLVDPTEGEVIALDEGYHFKDLPVHCVIDPRILKESHPSVCAHGALSTLARISDSLLAPAAGPSNEGNGNGDDGALLDLMAQTHLIVRKVLAIEASGAKDMRAEVKIEVGDATLEQGGAGGGVVEDVCEQYAALGCIEGRCVSVDGPGPVHALARIVSASYNLSFGQACALLLPEVATLQLRRGTANEETVAALVRMFAAGSSDASGSSVGVPELLSEMTERVRDDLRGRLPELGKEDIGELAFSALADTSFKDAANGDGGLKNWNRKMVEGVFEGAFGFLKGGGEKVEQ